MNRLHHNRQQKCHVSDKVAFFLILSMLHKHLETFILHYMQFLNHQNGKECITTDYNAHSDMYILLSVQFFMTNSTNNASHWIVELHISVSIIKRCSFCVPHWFLITHLFMWTNLCPFCARQSTKCQIFRFVSSLGVTRSQDILTKIGIPFHHSWSHDFWDEECHMLKNWHFVNVCVRWYMMWL